MPAPENPIKARLAAGEFLSCLWLASGRPELAEISGRAGFGCVVIDGEHAPNDIPAIAAQLAVLAGTGTPAAVRLPMGEDWMIKMALDQGAQTLIIPMVETAEEARRLVSATRYPPAGHRGMGAAVARASDWNRVEDYGATADRQICLIPQIETAAALPEIEAIAAVDGVDALLIGPSDLSATMGHPGDIGAVWPVIEEAITRIVATGKAAAIFMPEVERAARAKALGATLIAAGADTILLATAARDLARRFAAL
ncbi:MAG: HpcH/HpaI aldolase/citrate lyase family protein [Pseudomonadota bacterium]